MNLRPIARKLVNAPVSPFYPLDDKFIIFFDKMSCRGNYERLRGISWDDRSWRVWLVWRV